MRVAPSRCGSSLRAETHRFRKNCELLLSDRVLNAAGLDAVLNSLAAQAIRLTIVVIPIFCRHRSHSLCIKLANTYPRAQEGSRGVSVCSRRLPAISNFGLMVSPREYVRPRIRKDARVNHK
jgi:hypothetical protein